MNDSKTVVLRNAARGSGGKTDAERKEKGGREDRGVEAIGRERREEKSCKSFTQHNKLRKKPTYEDVDIVKG